MMVCVQGINVQYVFLKQKLKKRVTSEHLIQKISREKAGTLEFHIYSFHVSLSLTQVSLKSWVVNQEIPLQKPFHALRKAKFSKEML